MDMLRKNRSFIITGNSLRVFLAVVVGGFLITIVKKFNLGHFPLHSNNDALSFLQH